MKIIRTVVAGAFLTLAAPSTLLAQGVTDLGGGFAYAPVGNGQCRVLLDAKSGQPVLQTSKSAPSKVVLVGSGKECPKTYSDYAATRIASGAVSQYVFNGQTDNGRRLFIVRKTGSTFAFRYGPNPRP